MSSANISISADPRPRCYCLGGLAIISWGEHAPWCSAGGIQFTRSCGCAPDAIAHRCQSTQKGARL